MKTNRFKAMIEHMPHRIFMKDLNSVYITCNSAYSRDLGIEVEAIGGKTDFDFHPRELAQQYRDGDQQVIVSNSIEIFEEKYYVSGQEKWVRTTKVPFHDDDGHIAGIIGFFEDITPNKLTEEKLRQSEEYFRALIENSTDIILIVDLNSTITYASPSVERFTGYKPSEITGKSYIDFILPVDQQRALDNFRKAIKSKDENVASAFRVRHKNGSERVFEGLAKNLFANKAIAGFILNVHDVTEHKQTQEALRQSEEYFRALIENSTDIILNLNPEGTIIFASPSIERFLGYSSQEMVGKKCFDFIHVDDIPRAHDEFRQFLLTKEERIFKAFRIKDKNGSERIWEGTGKNLLENKTIAGFIINIRDITEEKKLGNQLRQAHRMEAIGTLASGIAHDFNNILTPILLGAEMVQLAIPKESPAHNDLQTVIQAAHRAQELIQQVLTFSRQREEERQPIKLEPVVKEILKLIRASLPSTIEINQNIEAVTDPVMANPIEIQQIMMNLCTNAAHAMRNKRGILDIRLTCENTKFLDPLRPQDLKPGNYVKISVRDTGQGIDEQIREKIFDPFFTTKERSKGTGLGLSVVHGIIESLEGKIAVESEIQKGTCFHVYLPCTQRKIITKAEEPELAPTGSERILFIDDDTTINNIYKNMLERLGYKVTIIGNALDAADLFRKNPNRFDLVITDQTMPKMTGLELAKEFLNVRPDLPIILCTGFNQETTNGEAAQAGIKVVLFKPVRRVALAQSIRNLLDQNRLPEKGILHRELINQSLEHVKK